MHNPKTLLKKKLILSIGMYLHSFIQEYTHFIKQILSNIFFM